MNNYSNNNETKKLKEILNETKKMKQKKYNKKINNETIIKINPLQKINEYQLKKINIEGEKIYEKNNFLSTIYDLMNNTIFSTFFKEYLKNYSDVQVATIYFYLYNLIKKQFNTYFKREITKGEMIFMMKEIMSNSESRKYLIGLTENIGLINIDNKHLLNNNEKNMIKDVNNILKNKKIEEIKL